MEKRPCPPVSRSDLPARADPAGSGRSGSHTSFSLMFLSREPVVPPEESAQPPAGRQLETRVQQCAPRVCVGPLDQVWGRWGWRVDAPPGAGTRECPEFPALALPPPLLSPWTLCRKEREGAGFSRSLFQVWVIADKVRATSLSRGTVCRRRRAVLEPKGRAGIMASG